MSGRPVSKTVVLALGRYLPPAAARAVLTGAGFETARDGRERKKKTAEQQRKRAERKRKKRSRK